MVFDWASVEFSAVNRKFSLELIVECLKLIFPERRTIALYEHSAGINRHGFEDAAAMVYNEGEGGMISVIPFKVEGVLYSINLHFYPEGSGASISLSLSQMCFEDRFFEKTVPDFISRCKAAYNCALPQYGRGDWSEILTEPISGKSMPSKNDVKGNLRRIYWLNFYGRDIVERVGLDRFKTIPYGRIEKLAGGGVLLIRGEHPNQYSESPQIEAMRRHLFDEGAVGRFMRYLGR